MDSFGNMESFDINVGDLEPVNLKFDDYDSPAPSTSKSVNFGKTTGRICTCEFSLVDLPNASGFGCYSVYPHRLHGAGLLNSLTDSSVSRIRLSRSS